MQKIILEKITQDGSLLQATFLPEKGMNLISYKKNKIEIIEQTTWNLFEERFAGLGALIGPHFHRRRPEIIPTIKDESLFPHIAAVKAKGVQEPFSHGIARYAPWKFESTQTSVKATLTGKDTWNNVPLSELEGQNFKMEYQADLKDNGLHLTLSIVSDTGSLVGIHYYYALPNGKGIITSRVQDQVIIEGKLQPIPKEWNYDDQQRLNFDLDQEADFTFHPHPDPLKGDILLETEAYHLRTRYSCNCQENCWQLYHPKNAAFVCIEPISAQDPRHANLTVSSLNIHLEIFEIGS
jgi:hypothetical protein